MSETQTLTPLLAPLTDAERARLTKRMEAQKAAEAELTAQKAALEAVIAKAQQEFQGYVQKAIEAAAKKDAVLEDIAEARDTVADDIGVNLKTGEVVAIAKAPTGEATA